MKEVIKSKIMEKETIENIVPKANSLKCVKNQTSKLILIKSKDKVK